MTNVFLDWDGPHTFEELLRSPELRARWEVPGVYLWFDKIRSDIYYIGKATGKQTLTQRQLLHYIYLIGGAAVIPGFARSSGRQWVFNLGEEGVVETVLNEHEFVEIVKEGFQFSRAIDIHFVEVNPSVLEIVERNLIYFIKPWRNWSGHISKPKSVIQLTHRNALWVTEQVQRTVYDSMTFV